MREENNDIVYVSIWQSWVRFLKIYSKYSQYIPLLIDSICDKMFQVSSNGLNIVLFVELNKLEKLKLNRNEHDIEYGVISSIKNMKTTRC